VKITFIPQNIVVEATPDKTLLQIATENNLEIKSICKGVPSCAECRVRIASGDHNLIPPGKAELNLIGTSYFIDSRRLSCQVHCFGDVTVDLTEQVERSENQTKKVRGFRISKTMESKAIQDTMMLNESEKITNERPERADLAEGTEKPEGQERGPRNNNDRQDRGNRGGNRGGGGRGGGSYGGGDKNSADRNARGARGDRGGGGNANRGERGGGGNNNRNDRSGNRNQRVDTPNANAKPNPADGKKTQE
jgi:ferredoxin